MIPEVVFVSVGFRKNIIGTNWRQPIYNKKYSGTFSPRTLHRGVGCTRKQQDSESNMVSYQSLPDGSRSCRYLSTRED